MRGELKSSIRYFSLFLCFLFPGGLLFPETIHLGDKKIPYSLFFTSDVDLQTAANGNQEIKLKRQAYPLSYEDSLDSLYISFDKNFDDIKSGSILKALFKTKDFEDSVGSAGSFEQPIHEMWVAPSDYMFLNNDTNTGDFSVYFRMRPYQLRRRMDVIQKVGLFEGRKQGIYCGWESGKLFFEFFNFFWNHDTPLPDLKISTRDSFQPNRFYSVMLNYKYNDGSLTLYLDGVEQEKIYATSDFSRNATILTPKFHRWDRSPVIIGKNYVGALDDIILSNHMLSPNVSSGKFNALKKNGSRISQTPGVVVSNLIELKSSKSKIQKATFDVSEPGGTEIRFYFRTSDNLFRPEISETAMPFIELTKTALSEARAKYFQWKAELYSDSTGTTTPVLKSMDLSYTYGKAPQPPRMLSVLESNNSEVTLEFLRSLEMHVIEGGRYHIYYGIKPYQPIGAIKYKSFEKSENGEMKGIPITDADRWVTDDQRYQNRIKLTITNDMIRDNETYFRNKPELSYEFPLLYKNVPYYFWVTSCDNEWSEKPENSDHESAPSGLVAVRLH
ncbi:MAG: LamG domain-containing protein [Spirochaetia bacterium]|nr:LamG domain-containing protein [Spirochaetia bacterium]